MLQAHQLIFEDSFIHELWRSFHLWSKSHIDDLCLDIDTRGNLCQLDAVLSEFEYSTFCDIENRLADFICVFTAEGDLFYGIQEFV